MSSGDSGVVVHNEDTYKANRARIQKMQEYIDAANALNEQGKRNFDQMEAELQNKIREGEEAQRMLAALQHAKPLLTYHDSDSQPPSSNFSLPLTNYAPTQTSPGPSARIEEVTDRNHTTEQSSAFYQPNYGQGYQPSQPQTRGRNEHYAPYESNPQYSNQGTQNVPGSSTLHGALGGQTQTHYVASQQTYQSSDPFIFTHYPNFQSGSRPNGASSQQSHAFSQQGVPRASATAQQSNSGAQMQSQPQRSQPYSQQGAFQPGIQPYGSQVPSQIRTGTQSQTRPQSHMGNPHLFGVPSQLNARQSQPTQTPVAAASMQSNPQMQPQRQSYVPQPGGSAQANKQMQIPPAPAQLNVQLRTPSSVAAAQSSSQPHMDALQGAPQASAAASQAAQRPVQTETQPSKATTQPEFVQSAPTPSYGMSPFAHVPTSTVAQAPQKPNPTVVHPQKPNPPAVPPRTDPVMPIQKPKPWNAAESSSSSAPAPVDSSTALVKSSAPKPTLATSANSRFNLFLNLINVWQRASPPTAFMDIPHARVRVTKFPNGEIHFSTADAKTGAEKRLSASVAFSQLAFNGRVQILINPKGIPTLLPEQKLPTTYKPFTGVEVKDAPQATFPDPPSAPAKPHDILRALGKGHVYAADDDRLRYAKRRALEAPEEAPPPPVLQPTLSKEPSAKTTPASSRASSVAPANRVPLFLPHADSSPPPIPVPVSVKMHHPWPSADDSFCVLIPPAPEYVQRHQAKMRREREQEQIAQMETQMEWQEEIPADPQELKRQRARGMYQNVENEEQAAAMLDACSRMYEMPCKWLSCGCVLNSFDTLITHLHEVHGKENDELETCMWDLCGDSFLNRTTLILHSETHVLDAIPCGYQDCDEVFHTPGQLVVHNHKHAEANRPLKPSAVPSALREPMPQPELPETPIPGWAVFIPPVQMPNISRDRHNTLGPWILRNICAPSAARARPYNAAMPLKFQPDYEFVETSSINYSCVPSRPARVRDMADLNSKEVSNQVAEGKLVFWPAPEPTEHKIEKLDAGKGPEEEEMAVESMLQDNIEGKEAIQNVA